MDANAACRVQPAPLWPPKPTSTRKVEEMLVYGARACSWGKQRDSNPRPPLEPQSADICFWRLPRIAEPAYLVHFLCSWLRLVSAYCAFSGVRSGTCVDASRWVQMSWCLT